MRPVSVTTTTTAFKPQRKDSWRKGSQRKSVPFQKGTYLEVKAFFKEHHLRQIKKKHRTTIVWEKKSCFFLNCFAFFYHGFPWFNHHLGDFPQLRSPYFCPCFSLWRSNWENAEDKSATQGLFVVVTKNLVKIFFVYPEVPTWNVSGVYKIPEIKWWCCICLPFNELVPNYCWWFRNPAPGTL